MRRVAIPIAAAGVLLLAACGGGGAEVETEATATPTVRPTPTTLSEQQEPTQLPPALWPTVIPPLFEPVNVPEPTFYSTRWTLNTQVAPPPPGVSRPLFFGQISTNTQCEHDVAGQLIGAVTTITVAPDPYWEGAPLTYTWSASNGSITGSGVTATWTRLIESGQVADGEVTVTVSDGMGGSEDGFGFQGGRLGLC